MKTMNGQWLICVAAASAILAGCASAPSNEKEGAGASLNTHGLSAVSDRRMVADLAVAFNGLEPFLSGGVNIRSNRRGIAAQLEKVFRNEGISTASGEPLFIYAHVEDGVTRMDATIGQLQLAKAYAAVDDEQPVQVFMSMKPSIARRDFPTASTAVTATPLTPEPSVLASVSDTDRSSTRVGSIASEGSVEPLPASIVSQDVSEGGWEAVTEGPGTKSVVVVDEAPLTILEQARAIHTPDSSDMIDNALESRYADQFHGTRVVETMLIEFGRGSVDMSASDLRRVQELAKSMNKDTDIVSVVATSNGATTLRNGNVALATGRTNRVVEALLRASVPMSRVFSEEAWSGKSQEGLPDRGAIVTLRRKS